MTDLTTDEQTVLLIAAKGERLMPIGRWKEPVESLVRKGLLVRERHPGDPTGHFNNVISQAGRAAANDLDTEFDNVLGAIVAEHTKAVIHARDHAVAINHTRDRFRADAERIAAMIVELARESIQVTGEDVGVALKNWTKSIVARAREMVR